MSIGNETNFEALLLAFNGPRDCYSKHYAPSAASQIVHADGNDFVMWGQSQTTRYKNINSTNLILTATTVYIDVHFS